MNIFALIAQAIKRSKLFSTEPNTSLDAFGYPKTPADSYLRDSRNKQARVNLINKVRKMYQEDSRIKGALSKLGRDVVRLGFTVHVSGPQEKQVTAIIDNLLKTLELGPGSRSLSKFVRSAGRDGDLFLQLILDESGQIIGLSKKPVKKMTRLTDDFDRFTDPEKAFRWGGTTGLDPRYSNEEVVYLPAFVVIHARWDHDSEEKYGTPEFSSAISSWTKLVDGENDIALRRRANSGTRRVHHLKGASPADVLEYQRVNEPALTNPFAGHLDYFINFDGGITELSGDPRLGDIADLEHHLQTVAASSTVPLELFAYGGNLNRDVLEDKKASYQDTLPDIQDWLTSEILRPLIERQLLLQGFLPELSDIQVVWKKEQKVSPETMKTLAETAASLKSIGWPDELIWDSLSEFLPEGIDTDLIMEHLSKQETQKQQSEQDRLAQIEQILSRNLETNDNQDQNQG